MSNLRMLCNLMDFGARSRVETESRKSETKIESAKRAEAHKENFGGNFISIFFHGCVKMGASENVRSLYFPFALRHLHCHTMGGGYKEGELRLKRAASASESLSVCLG